MPRFHDNEKEIIKQKLFKEGERLFNTYGIKKVSIDELVQAVGIAKGSFYTFFPSKEQLFMEIVFAKQQQIWTEMDEFLKAHCNLPPRELTKLIFMWTLEQVNRHPLISKMDKETTEYLYRRLPREVIEAHSHDDGVELLKLEQYGIRFKCGIEMATKILQSLAVSYINLSGEDEAVQLSIINTMLDGILKEIVEDTNG